MKQMLLATITLLACLAGYSQEKKESMVKPSAAAEGAFKKAYPTATAAKWKKEDNDFEVVFMKEKMEMSAVYTKEGQLKETEEKISTSQLPAAINNYVKQHYKQSIKEAEKVVKGNGEINYEVVVGEMELIFDKDGKFLKQEKEDND